MRNLPALLTVLLLLLPSGLGAVVFPPETCANSAMAMEMLCCCQHQANPAEQAGPFLERKCCCAVDGPEAPAQDPAPVRFSAQESFELGSWLDGAEEAVAIPQDFVAPAHLRVEGPPRALTLPLFLLFQRFVI